MITKSEISRKFLERLEPKIKSVGFNKLLKNTFLKPVSPDLMEMLRFEFIGSGIVEAVCYFGVRVQSIESELEGMSFFVDKGTKFSRLDATVFQRIDLAMKIVTGRKETSSFRASDTSQDIVEAIVNILAKLSPAFSSILDLSSYCLIDKNLPLGHHAFRVPFLLVQAGLQQECDDYIHGVIEKGFITDFDKFVEEFRQKQTKLINAR